MRQQAEAALGHDPGFVSVDARAEELPFDDMVLDLITCSQSFHWFDNEQARAEFSRVLHGGGHLCCAWNELDEAGGGATHHVISALRSANTQSPRARGPEQMKQVFAAGTMIHKVFIHEQELDLARVISLLRSRSYWPSAESEEGSRLESEVLNSLQSYARKGTVKLQYRCSAYAGQMD
jgi:SAM-dependent methyltransferase